jgi:hypothetical protein
MFAANCTIVIDVPRGICVLVATTFPAIVKLNVSLHMDRSRPLTNLTTGRQVSL